MKPVGVVLIMIVLAISVYVSWSRAITVHMRPVGYSTLLSTASLARWLSESSFVTSSLETGRVGYLEAFSTEQYGYAYSYYLEGQPKSLSVDPDSGMLSLDVPLSPGSYQFTVLVVGRAGLKLTTRHWTQLVVRKGVTEGRSGDEILHKSYDVHDAARFGSPNGDDWTGVLLNVRQAIVEDQTRVGDENLRVTIYFRRGIQYNYTNNRWAWGIQYLTVEPHPDLSPTEPRPRLRSVAQTTWGDISRAALRTGRSYAAGPQSVITEENLDNPKLYSALIFSSAPGTDSIRLKDPAEAKRLTVGRYHLIASYDQQAGWGFPPNARYFEYAKIAEISGDVVVLDRKLRHGHQENFWEAPGNPNSIGKARIIPLDRGGVYSADSVRLTLRATYKNLEFLPNPVPGANSGTVQIEGGVDIEFQDCVVPHYVITAVRFARITGGSWVSGEPDKAVSMLVVDKVSAGGAMGEATGVDYFLVKNSSVGAHQIAPRQLRAINVVFNSSGDHYYAYPLTFKGGWTTLDVDLSRTTLRRDWSTPDYLALAAPKGAALRLGSEGTWSGSQLLIPKASSAFSPWLWGSWEGAIIYFGPNPGFKKYGVIRKISGSEDGSMLILNVEWLKGKRPSEGVLHLEQLHSVSLDEASRIAGGISWADTGAMRQHVPGTISPFGTRPFPRGYKSPLGLGY